MSVELKIDFKYVSPGKAGEISFMKKKEIN